MLQLMVKVTMMMMMRMMKVAGSKLESTMITANEKQPGAVVVAVVGAAPRAGVGQVSGLVEIAANSGEVMMDGEHVNGTDHGQTVVEVTHRSPVQSENMPVVEKMRNHHK